MLKTFWFFPKFHSIDCRQAFISASQIFMLLPGSQKTSVTIMADVKQCNNMINSLKEDMKRAREEGDQDEVEDCGERIKRYKRMRDNLGAQLFETE